METSIQDALTGLDALEEFLPGALHNGEDMRVIREQIEAIRSDVMMFRGEQRATWYKTLQGAMGDADTITDDPQVYRRSIARSLSVVAGMMLNT